MERKYYPLTGVEGISVAKDVNDTSDAYSAGAPSDMIPTQEVNWASEQPSEDIYASNKRQDTIYGTKKETITFQTPNLSAEEDAEFRGIYLKQSSGRVYGTGNEEPPFVAMGFKMSKGKGDAVYMWFPKGKVTGGNIVATTKNNGVTLSTRQYNFEAYVTDKQWMIDGRMQGISWVKGDTTTPAFNPEAWFDQVQTPDTESAPAELALSSIDPADGSTDIAVDKEIKLTFNNPIDSESIVLMDDSDDSFVEVTRAWTSDRKQLSLIHAQSFTQGGVYKVVGAGIKDVYGYKLAAFTSDFTVASS